MLEILKKLFALLTGLFITATPTPVIETTIGGVEEPEKIEISTVCDTKLPGISIESTLKTYTVDNRALNTEEKSFIKSCEIIKKEAEIVGEYTKDDIKVEIVGEIKQIKSDGQSGVELFARAWKGKNQLGFGKDGSIEIERFRIFNPPALVSDPNGTIVREYLDDFTDKQNPVLKTIKYREDITQAVRNRLMSVIKISGKENSKIITGKIGNTTDIYPSGAGDDSAENGGQANWAACRASATAAWGIRNSTIAIAISYVNPAIYRISVPIDTSGIPDGDTVSSTTLMVFVNSIINDTAERNIVLTKNTRSNSAGAMITADFAIANFFTEIGSRKDITTLSTSVYTSWALTDNTYVSKTGYTNFGIIISDDFDNAGTSALSGIQIRTSEYTGTDTDPILIVDHSAPASAPSLGDIIIFE